MRVQMDGAPSQVIHILLTDDVRTRNGVEMLQRAVVALASGSAVRRRLLEATGLKLAIRPAHLDERGFVAAMERKGAARRPADTALALARAKAMASIKAAGSAAGEEFYIAADQVLVFKDKILNKVSSLSTAYERLRALRGRTHHLVGACVLARAHPDGSEVLWSRVDRVAVTMGDYSEAALQAYLEDAGDAVLRSVSCYEIEAAGAQLITGIDGDYFSALGLPLLPLMEALRQFGAVAR